MAKDIFSKKPSRNFARGEAPPSDSYEWAGTSLPPPGRPRKETSSSGATVVILNQGKRSVWPWIFGLTGIGALYTWSKRRS